MHRNLGNDTVEAVLNQLMTNSQQSYTEFSNIFPISNLHHCNDSSINQVLNFLDNDASRIISDLDHDLTVNSTLVNHTINNSQPTRSDFLSDSGTTALDMVMSHLQAQENSLEFSREYETSINRPSYAQRLTSYFDNQLAESTASELTSSEQPDNDQIRISTSEPSCNSENLPTSTLPDDFEVIDLSNESQTPEVDMFNHNIKLRIDNFIYHKAYDSDKDIDETNIAESSSYVGSWEMPAPLREGSESAIEGNCKECLSTVGMTMDTLPGECEFNDSAPELIVHT